MPVFREGKGRAPAWCELESFDLLELKEGETRKLRREARQEELIVCRGRVTVSAGGVECSLTAGCTLDLAGPSVKRFQVRAAPSGPALVCLLRGRWQSVSSSGVFAAQTGQPPLQETPYAYEKTTGFDNHFHDCDEYWIVFEGEATVASEGKFYTVGPGDCVATGMGWHHDILHVKGAQPLRAVWLEGTLAGQCRPGHLCEPLHGQAEPQSDRT